MCLSNMFHQLPLALCHMRRDDHRKQQEDGVQAAEHPCTIDAGGAHSQGLPLPVKCIGPKWGPWKRRPPKQGPPISSQVHFRLGAVASKVRWIPAPPHVLIVLRKSEQVIVIRCILQYDCAYITSFEEVLADTLAQH